MPHDPPTAPPPARTAPVLLGAGARVGRAVTAAWRQAGQPHHPLTRAGWDMLAAPPPACPAAEGQAVIVLAGVVPGRGGALADNLALARAGVAAAGRWGAAHVLVVSSQAVYGPTAPGGADETVPPAPRGAYAAAKHEMEQAVAGPGVTALRLANVAGLSEPFVALARGPGALTLDRFADGTGPVRSFIGAGQLARVLAGLADLARRGADLPAVLNVAAPGPVAMADIAGAAGREVVWRPALEGAIAHVCLDCARLDALVGLAPEPAAALVADAARFAP